jgi:RNA polymerase sigma-70 factor (ECF subfamily)
MASDFQPGAGDRQREHELHSRLLAGARSATADLVNHFLRQLVHRLQADFPSLRSDPDLEGCALTALEDYFLAPDRYRPERGTLWTFLHVAADRDARNLLKQRSAHPTLPLEERVAEDPAAWNDLMRECLGELPGLPAEVTMEEVRARVLGRLPDEGDRRILWLLMRGEATHERCVAALGLEGQTRPAQEAAIKRAKDRAWAAIRRTREGYRNG